MLLDSPGSKLAQAMESGWSQQIFGKTGIEKTSPKQSMQTLPNGTAGLFLRQAFHLDMALQSYAFMCKCHQVRTNGMFSTSGLHPAKLCRKSPIFDEAKSM